MSLIEKSIADNQRIVEDSIEAENVIEADSLVEEVSIDGMCGVY